MNFCLLVHRHSGHAGELIPEEDYVILGLPFPDVPVTCAEDILLAAITCERYVAICHLFNCLLLMIPKVCVYWLTGTWLRGLENSVTHSVLAVMFTLCGLNQISHFLCAILLLLELSCSDISLNESVFHVASTTTGLNPCLFTAMSYILIIFAILRVPSGQKQGLYLGIPLHCGGDLLWDNQLQL